MSTLPNADFAVGLEGWVIVELFASGASWRAEDGVLVVESRDAARSAAGTVQVHSPRVAATPGRWTVTLDVRVSEPCLVDVGVVAPGVIAVPGPPMQAPPFETFEVEADQWTAVGATRLVGPEAENVGVRLLLPAGVDVEMRAVDLRRQGADPAPATLAIGFGATGGAFTAGAIVARDESRRLPVLVSNPCGDPVEAALRLVVTDAYRGDHEVVGDEIRSFPPGLTSIEVELPSGTNGCFVLDGTVTAGADSRAQFRYIVDDDAGVIEPDPSAPWGVTAGAMARGHSAAMLGLLGVAHTRLYSGFGSWDSDAVEVVADAATADALAATLRFVGVATGSRAGQAARRHASGGSGLGQGGWPNFADASGFLADAADDQLAPTAALAGGLEGMTVLAETTLHHDQETWTRFVRATARGLRHHPMSWAAANEPDLGGHEPETFAALQRTFTAAVRQGDPDAVVVGPMLADGWDGGHQGLTGWSYIERWAAAGGMEAVDAVSVHLHMIDEETSTPEREDLQNRLTRLRALVDGLGGASKPLWITEMGWRSRSDAAHGFGASETGPRVEEWEQADLLVRAACLAVSAGVERFYAFHLHGFRPFCEGYGFEWGIVAGPAGGPKPAFAAMRSLVRFTHGLRPNGSVRTDPRVRVVLFSGEGRAAAVVWQWSGGPGLFRLGELPDEVIVRDLMNAPADGHDLRRPVVVSWPTSAGDIVAWLETRLAERFPTTYSYGAKQKGDAT
ncbi:MAG TPA: hypothetical protein VFA83_22440 [Acidimicrobiales bacterium]|nr:hypothetical protein [Acidimicrobiales bacterium]